MTRVSLVKGINRRDIIKRSVNLLSDDVKNSLRIRQIIVKPNFVSISTRLAVSHVDQIRGILDALQEYYTEKVIIAEAACGDTVKAFRNFGYYDLLKEYDVELIDLNKGPFEQLPVQDRKGRTVQLRAASLLLDKDNYLISSARLKTHDTVVVTLSIKNMVMGCIYLKDKEQVHQGIKQINKNLAKVAEHVWPDLAVIDGFEGMEGNGPTQGSPIHVGVALSSIDPLAADRVACEVMGVDFNKVGYLNYCSDKGLGESDLKNIEIVGDRLEACIKPFRLHRKVQEQYQWRE